MQIVRCSLRLNFVRQVPDAKREHIGASEYGVDLKIATVEVTGPASLDKVKVKPAVLAVDSYVVEHENQWSVASHPWPTSSGQ
jgi:hypothetical protein